MFQPANPHPAGAGASADPRAEYWVHWRYSEAEWQAWIEAEREQTGGRRVRQRAFLGGMCVLLAVVISVGLLIGGGPTITNLFGIGMLWFVATPVALILFFDVVYYARQAPRMYARQQRALREVAINPWWVWQGGEFTPLLRAAQNRLHVRLIPHPWRLHFRVEEFDWRLRTVIRRDVTVLVPQGQEAAAQHLVTRFEREIIGIPPPPVTPDAPPAPPVGAPPAPAGLPVPTTRLPPPRMMEAETQVLREGAPGRPQP
jgi:hypothetical protein